MIRQKQGYALISTLAVMVIIMALCSMLVAHSIYGRSLAKSAVVRYERNRDYSAQGEAFVSDARRFGDQLLEAYLAEGYTPNSADEVYKSEDGVYSRVKQVTDVALQRCTVTLHYKTDEGVDKAASLFVCPGENLGEAAGAYASGYAADGVYHYFIGWDCDGDGETAEYADSAQLPVITEDSHLTAVYSVGTAFTLKLLQEDGSPMLTEPVEYLGGETLGSVLNRAIEEQQKIEEQQEIERQQAVEEQQAAEAEPERTDAETDSVPLSETLRDSRWFEMREQDVSGVLQGASLRSGSDVRFFSTPEAALNASLPGDTITLLTKLTAPLTVDKAVTVCLPEDADGALDTEMILPGENYCVKQSVIVNEVIRAMTFEGMVEVYTVSRGETDAGSEQTAEYQGTLEEITDIVSFADGEGCYSDAQGRSPGIRILGDICLDRNYEFVVPLLPMDSVTVNLNGHAVTGAETLLKVQEQGAFTLLNGTLGSEEHSLAAELKGGSLTLENVNVRGDIASAGAAAVSMNGGSLTGSVSATGVGELTMSGSEEEMLPVSGSVEIGGTVYARLSCCAVCGDLRANSSVTTELYGVTTEGQPSGRYEVHHYVENISSDETKAEQVEILYRPVESEDTLWGDMTLVAMPKNTACTTYYDAAGAPVRTCLKTPDIPESERQPEPAVLWNGSTNCDWETVSASDVQTAYPDAEKYPVFAEPELNEAVSVPIGMGPITFSYCLGDGVSHVVRKTMQSNDDLVFAYYTPGSRTPNFFVDAQGVRVEEGSGKYQSCCAAASGKQQSGLLVIPLYSQTEIRWGTEEGEPAAEAGQTAFYSPGNDYVRFYTLTFLWPDGSEGKNKTEVSVPGGTAIQFVFYKENAEHSGYVFSAAYPLTETEPEITAEDVERGWRLEHSPESSPQLRVFCRAGLCEEWAEEYCSGDPTVWEDRVFTVYGGDLFYSDADGQFCRISFCGVPKGTPVIFAYCKRGGSVLPGDSGFLAEDGLSAFQNLARRLREEIGAADTENTDNSENEAASDEKLRAAMTEALADGWFYCEDREHPENRALVLLIYSDAPVTWYSMPAGSEAGTITQSDAIGKICAGQTKATKYTLCVESIPPVGQKSNLLKVSVSAEDFRILEWKAGN